MKIIAWLIAIPLAVVVVVFAIANRGTVDLSFDPLPYALSIPIWALAAGALVVGFLLGALIRWLLDHKTRAGARQSRRRARALEREIAELRARNRPRGVAIASRDDGRQDELPAPKDVA